MRGGMGCGCTSSPSESCGERCREGGRERFWKNICGWLCGSGAPSSWYTWLYRAWMGSSGRAIRAEAALRCLDTFALGLPTPLLALFPGEELPGLGGGRCEELSDGELTFLRSCRESDFLDAEERTMVLRVPSCGSWCCCERDSATAAHGHCDP